MSRPPVSKTTPLPTRATSGRSGLALPGDLDHARRTLGHGGAAHGVDGRIAALQQALAGRSP